VASDFRSQIEAQRPYLLRYASMELRNSDAAEDAVQETLLAALAAEASFAGRSNLRTWLTGILKHKIIDTIRRTSRERPLESLDGESTIDDLEALFDETGHWREPPQAWPEQALQEKQFLQALEKCLAALPARTGHVFLMREHLGFDTPDICKELGITSTHCWVLLYRARMALRECLEKGWVRR
jgi:RNA polymerase sigma-70 factor (ECF subfamily)